MFDRRIIVWGMLSVLALVAFISVFGFKAATLIDARNAKGTGMNRSFPFSKEKILKVVPDAIMSLGLTPVVQDSKDLFLAERHDAFFSHGQKVAVFIEEISQADTKVEVVSKRVRRLDITATNWEKPLLNRIDELLKTKK
jgi:hypothetical protein